MVLLGRLVRSKLPDHAIAAFRIVKSAIPRAELWIIGDGYLRNRLERDAPDGVRFLGRIDDKTKFEILSECHVLLAPSVREGWGISIIEANAMGTPAVGYAVRGLRDSIRDNITGYLVPPGDYFALAKKAIEVLSNSDVRLRLSNDALLWSREFSWDDAAKDFLGFLQEFSRSERASC
jgi:glycosyltransferase involved in cell wall biosynthesis